VATLAFAPAVVNVGQMFSLGSSTARAIPQPAIGPQERECAPLAKIVAVLQQRECLP
jgi:hypothetical protein